MVLRTADKENVKDIEGNQKNPWKFPNYYITNERVFYLRTTFISKDGYEGLSAVVKFR